MTWSVFWGLENLLSSFKMSRLVVVGYYYSPHQKKSNQDYHYPTGVYEANELPFNLNWLQNPLARAQWLT